MNVAIIVRRALKIFNIVRKEAVLWMFLGGKVYLCKWILIKKHTRMKKNILIVSLLASLFLGMPQTAGAAESIEIIENEQQPITISVSSESVLHVTGAAGQTLYIYNVTGVRVMSIKVDGSDKSYNLNLQKGCYIVKVGKTVRKISVR